MKSRKVKERAYEFAIKIIELSKRFSRNTAGYVVGGQVVRAGTSIGANIEEAEGAYSKDEFIYKMSVSLKEARETNYWLRLIRDTNLIKDVDIEFFINESREIKNILVAIVKTSRLKKTLHSKL